MVDGIHYIMEINTLAKKFTFESNDSDDESDLSDNFKEFHVNSFLKRYAVPGIKYLSKNEADWKTVESFGNEFKTALEDVRNTLEVSYLADYRIIPVYFKSNRESIKLEGGDFPNIIFSFRTLDFKNVIRFLS